MSDAANEATRDTALDTGAEQLGKTYARALVGAAQNAGVTDQVVVQISELAQTLAGSAPLQSAFSSPRIGEDEKCRIIDRLVGPHFHPVLVTFLKVMARRGRLGYVGAVARAADDIHDDMMGRLVAQVRTAVPMDDQLRQQIVQRLSETMHAEVRLKESVDPDLIGGMVIRIGDQVFDSSVSNRMSQMRRRVQKGFAAKLMQSFEKFTQTSD